MKNGMLLCRKILLCKVILVISQQTFTCSSQKYWRTRERSEVYSNLHHRRCSGIFIVTLDIFHTFFYLFLSLFLSMYLFDGIPFSVCKQEYSNGINPRLLKFFWPKYSSVKKGSTYLCWIPTLFDDEDLSKCSTTNITFYVKQTVEYAFNHFMSIIIRRAFV